MMCVELLTNPIFQEKKREMISDNKMRKKKKIIKDIRKRRIKTKECGKKKGKKRREPMLIRMKCDLVAFLGKSDTFLIDV